MFDAKINKTLKKSLDNATNENKHLRKILKQHLEDSIMTINQVQDIQALGNTEREKDIMRNNIINKKRTEYVTKIIELDDLPNHTNSRI